MARPPWTLLPAVLTILLVAALAGGDRPRPAATPSSGPGDVDGGQEIEWLAAGPYADGLRSAFTDPIDRDWLAERGGEAGARPLAVQRLDEHAWLPVPSYGGQVFLSGLAGTEAGGTAYAYREVIGDGLGPALLVVEASCPLKIWIEGRLVYARYATSFAAESLAVGLRRGRNSVLVKVSGSGTRLDFSLAIQRPGDAVTAVREGGTVGRTATGGVEVSPGTPGPRILERVVAVGGTIRGLLPAWPPGSATPGRPGPGGSAAQATPLLVEGRDGRGRLLVSCEAWIGEAFELRLPPDFVGSLHLGLRGSSRPGSLAYVGDARGAALAAAAAARTESARPAVAPTAGGAGPAVVAPGGWDRSATLDFLAGLLDGSGIPDFPGSSGAGAFDAAMDALDELAALRELPAAGDGILPPGRAWRLAYRSALDGALLSYSAELPPSSAVPRGEAPGLLVALHDEGESDLEVMDRLRGLAARGIAVIVPGGRGGGAWSGLEEGELDATLALAPGLLPTAADRLWIAGWGRGGSGALRQALLHPARYAAVVAVGGRPGGEELEPLVDLPVLHVRTSGEAARDPGLRAGLTRLEAAGARLEVVDADAAAGNRGDGPLAAWESWTSLAIDPLADWLLAQRKAESPLRVEIRAPSIRYGGNPRVSLLEVLDPGRAGALSFELLDSRHVSIATENVAAFELDLRGGDLAAKGRVVAEIDGAARTLDARSRTTFVAVPSGTGGGFEPGGQAGAEGGEGAERTEARLNSGEGLAGLFRSPLVIVYGSRRPGRAQELRDIARWLGRGMTGRIGATARGIATIPVLVDSEATAEVLAGRSVLLVGGVEDNRLSARLLPLLPPGLREDLKSSAGFGGKAGGLVLTCPYPGAPSFLLGLVAPAASGPAALAAIEAALASLRPDEGDPPARDSFRTPDLLVYDRGGRAALESSFDRNWEKLRPWGSS